LKYMVVIEDKFPCGQTDEEVKMKFDKLVKSASDIKEKIDILENLTKKLTTFLPEQ
uniref:Mediator complex subunit 30 n=1 Tax=Rodentolepis nana TaxID=102285 RepID=A0A0R3T9L6_RODNA